jgi:putative transposase
VLRYIESNPLRAGLASNLQQYQWTSYAVHGLGQADELITQLPDWRRLGRTERARQAYWRRLVHTALTQRELAEVRRAVTSGRPFGSPSWVEATARILGVDLVRRPRGRPRKQPEK